MQPRTEPKKEIRMNFITNPKTKDKQREYFHAQRLKRAMNSAAENDWRGPSISKVDAYRLLQQPPPLPAPPPYLSFPLKTNLNHHLHKDAVSSTETDGGGGGGRDQGPLVLVSKETPKLQNPGFSTSSHSSKLSRYKINNNSSNAYEDENKDGKKRKKQKTRRSNLLGDITTTATGCRHYPNYNKDSISSNNILPPSDPLDDFFNDSHTLISKFGFKPSAPPLFNDQFFAPTKTTCTPIHSSESSPRGVHCQQQSEGEATLSVLSKFGFRDPVSHSLTSPLLRLKTASVSATTATNEDVYHRSEEEEEKDAEMREEGVEENRVDNERADLSVMAHFDDDEDDRATLPYTGHSFVSKSESPYSVENGGTDGVDGGGVGGGYELRRNVLAVSFLKKRINQLEISLLHSKLETLHVKNRLEGLNREVAVIKTEQLELMNTVFERFYNSSQRVHVDHRLSNNTTATQTPKSSSGPRIPWDNNTSITTPFYHARTRSLLPRLLSPLPPPFAPPPSESSLESSSTSSSSSSSSPLPSPSQQKLPSTLSRGGDGAPFCDDSVGGGEGMNYEQKDITPAPSASPTPSHATKTTTQDHTQVMTAAVGSFTMSSLLESDHQRPLPLVSINNNNSTVISSQFTDFEKTVAKITTNESADGTLVDGKEADVKKRGLMHLLDHGFVGNGNIGDGESEWPRLTANSWVAEDEQMVVMEEMISGRSLLTKKTDADGSSLSALVSDLLLATNTEVVEGLAAAAELVVEEEEVINLKMSFAESLADDCFQD